MNVGTLVSDSLSNNSPPYSVGNSAVGSRSNGHSRVPIHIKGRYVSPSSRSSGRIYDLNIGGILEGHPIHTNETLISYGITNFDERGQLLSALGSGKIKEGADIIRQSELIAREKGLAEHFAASSEQAREAFMTIARYVADFGVTTTRRLVDRIGIKSIAEIGYNPLMGAVVAAYNR